MINQKILEVAFSFYGQKEVVGSNHNPEIVNFFKGIGYDWVKDDETPWCSAFVGYCITKAGIILECKLNARSWLNFGWEIKENPKLGDICIFWRTAENSPYGHAGFFVNQDATHIYVLGGNQQNAVNISKYPKSRLLGIRRLS